MTINFPIRKTKALLKQLIQAGLAAADPVASIPQVCNRKDDTLCVGRRRYDLQKYERVVCMGIGKASARMAMALRQLLGKHLDGGLIIVKDYPNCPIKNIDVWKAGHPIPNAQSHRAAKAAERLLKSLTTRDLLIVLISGGSSSLLASPTTGLTLKNKQRTTHLLLRSGATIQEMNIVRKHLSAIKGGQFITSTSATIISLILSDVLDDDLSTIGSGLTSPDPSTFLDARHILDRYHLWNRIPAAVKHHIVKGIKEVVPETIKPGAPQLKRVQNVIIGNNQLAVKQIAKTAKRLGLCPHIQTTSLQGEAKEIGSTIASLAKNIGNEKGPIRPPACIIWGGEPTVTVTGQGKGGRAQECALSAAIGMAGLSNMIMAGLGTDGSDGPTDVAGAVIDGNTIARATLKGINADKALQTHDSYTFFKQVDGHIKTGPTGTNVNDIYLLLAL